MEMRFSEVLFWYDIHELQVTEDNVYHDLKYDDKGNSKPDPSPQRVRKIALEKIKERKEKNGS